MSAIDVLREYGSAIRGDWGAIDGRSVLMDIDKIAHEIESGGTMSDGQLRDSVGICTHGGGHWQDYCNDLECGEGETP